MGLRMVRSYTTVEEPTCRMNMKPVCKVKGDTNKKWREKIKNPVDIFEQPHYKTNNEHTKN